MKYYMYVFVMPGLSPEQVAVQAAHVAYEAGSVFYDINSPPPNLVLISANLTGVIEYLETLGIDYTTFYEDMYNSPVMTAVATIPLSAESLAREKLSVFSTLRFRTSLSY